MILSYNNFVSCITRIDTFTAYITIAIHESSATYAGNQ